MVPSNHAQIIVNREGGELRRTSLSGNTETASDAYPRIMRRVIERLDPNIGGSTMAIGEVRRGFAAGQSIRRQAEGVHHAGAEQIRVTHGERLGQAIIPITCAEHVLV